MTLVLTPTLSGHDGLSCLSRQVVTALSTSGSEPIKVLALANASSEPSWPSRVTVTNCGGRRTEFMWRASQAARTATAASRVVVLHAHLLPGAWPAIRRGATLVPILVGVEAWQPLSWARRQVLGHARRAIAISHHTAERFRAANPRFATLPIDVCWPSTPEAPPVDDGLTTVGRPFALIVGRMSADERYKGHDLLIDIWPDVRKAVPEATLVVAGTGDDEARLRCRAERSGLAHCIEFVGAQSPLALQRLYRDCAFLVMPSRDEGFGLVFLEAMAAARACVGGRGAAEEIIVREITGLIVDPDHPDEVRAAVVRLFADPILCTRFGRAGQQRAAQVFSMERFTRELSAIVRDLPRHPAATAC